MVRAMTAAASLSPVDLARDLQELATLVGSEQAVDDVLRRGLDWLARVAPYDLATVFVLEKGRLVVRAARAADGEQDHGDGSQHDGNRSRRSGTLLPWRSQLTSAWRTSR